MEFSIETCIFGNVLFLRKVFFPRTGEISQKKLETSSKKGEELPFLQEIFPEPLEM